jgi:hypothetical protein
MKDLIKRILREETKGELNNRARHLLGVMAAASLKNVADGDIESMRNALKDVEESGIDWNKDVVKSVKQTYDDLMLRAKQILREEKKKLFIPRNIDERSVEFGKMVKGETNKFLIDNDIKSLNYIVKVNQLWDNLEYSDISNAFWDNTNCEVIFNNGEKWVNSYSWTKISHSDFIGYSHIMSAYLNKLINKHNPEDLVLDDLEIEVYCVVDSIKMDFIFTHQNKEVVSFSKTI